METRVATIGIIVENMDSVEPLNSILHDYSSYIIGRMGIPYRDKSINVILIAMDAPQDEISAMSGKIGRLKGVTAKTAFSSVVFKNDRPGAGF
jgi:putative iron-only hydrogenase system regulator